jgi:hypothetical protein
MDEQLRSKNDLAWRLWPLRYSLILLAVLFFVVCGFVFLRSDQVSDWQNVFVRAAKRLQAREPIHRTGDNYTYPPAMAMLSAPLASLPPFPSLFAWYLVNVAAATVALICAWRLAGGPSLIGLAGRWQASFWIGMALAGRFFIAPLENRQFDMVIAALLFAGCYQLWRGRDLTGAAWLGASAAMKCTPLLFAPYLLWRGKLKAVFVLVAVAASLNVLPDLLWPQTSGRLYLADWYVSYLATVGRSAPGNWFSDVLLNQSLAGLFNRFIRLGLPLWGEQLRIARASMPDGALGVLRLFVYGSGLLLLAITAWRFGKPWTAAPTLDAGESGTVPWEKLQTGIESAAVVCLMLLLSPISSKSHYVVLLLPSFILARLAVDCRPPWLMGLLVALLITGPLTAKGLIGKEAGGLALAWGFPTWFVFSSLLGIWGTLGAVRIRQGSCAR